ncbi:alpha/beta hydrolase [Sandarakinorhabdus limnophila]|jgi:pimeloyl-ACP methyl ester carboxylesterase|uniref:alpha/beta hydrolase n=1 Tax=Sandarakinorhabdus limnophila TaxID=210512 RepID=UPI0026F261A5|nr:alpha/beta hydrolase [Sandarakinorhabdus limnophila]
MSYARIPLLIAFREAVGLRDTYGGIDGVVALQAHHLKPETPSDTIVIFMHPMGIMHYLPLPPALADAGVHVLTAVSRYPNNDNALIMEKVAVDLGRWVAHCRDVLGYKRVVLAGWSGGGSLALFYQAEAADPQVTHTPAGDPFPMAEAKLPPVDGIMLLAAHVSRSQTLTEWLDASVVDENGPVRDPKWDLYDAACPQPPYSADFLAEYAARQVARSNRITAWAEATLAELKAREGPHAERAFIVHGTMAAPCWLDPAVDANDRAPGRCYLGDPRLINDSPGGLGRFTTLRSWLSQWSLESNACSLKVGHRIRLPVLLVGNTADDACTPSHTRRLFDCVENATSRDLHEVKGATHYYAFQPEHLRQAAGIVTDWLGRQAF